MTQPMQQTTYEPRTHCNVERLNKLIHHLEWVWGASYFDLDGKQAWIRRYDEFECAPRERTGFNMAFFFKKLDPIETVDEESKRFDSCADLAGWTLILFHKKRIEEIDGPLMPLIMDRLNVQEEEANALCWPETDTIFVGTYAQPIHGQGLDTPDDQRRRGIRPSCAAHAIRRFMEGYPLHQLYDFREEMPWLR